jgi:hypothetical protein
MGATTACSRTTDILRAKKHANNLFNFPGVNLRNNELFEWPWILSKIIKSYAGMLSR